VLKQQSSAVDASLRTFDLAMLTIALPTAYHLRDALLGNPRNLQIYRVESFWPLLAVTLLLWLITSWMFRVYDVYRTRPIVTELSRLARAMALVALAIAAGGYFSKHHEVSRLFVGLYFVVAFALLVSNRIALRKIARAARRRGYNLRRFAVVGTGALAEEVVESMAAHPEWGYQFSGFILEQGAPLPQRRPVLGKLESISELLENNVLDEVVFAVSRDHLEEIQGAVRLCEEQGIEVKICLNLFNVTIGKMAMAEVSGLPALSLSSTPRDELALVAKRVFDVVVSAVMLLLVAPLFAVVAVAIKLDSRGPVFFRQRRVGLHGREFVFYKFRSMVEDAESLLESLRERNEVTGPVFKMKKDPRVTAVGRFIRRTSIDELPQFWNVLKGEMSVVGPRPPTPNEVRKYKPWQRRRLSVKPGITCTWQVSGRSNIDFDRWMELDLAYIDQWSLWGDVQICLKTIPAVLGSRGAH
jgi:exopolysaccharide biosynthesis polyprenyl glycosylphosphotransferase